MLAVWRDWPILAVDARGARVLRLSDAGLTIVKALQTGPVASVLPGRIARGEVGFGSVPPILQVCIA